MHLNIRFENFNIYFEENKFILFFTSENKKIKKATLHKISAN